MQSNSINSFFSLFLPPLSQRPVRRHHRTARHRLHAARPPALLVLPCAAAGSTLIAWALYALLRALHSCKTGASFFFLFLSVVRQGGTAIVAARHLDAHTTRARMVGLRVCLPTLRCANPLCFSPTVVLCAANDGCAHRAHMANCTPSRSEHE